MFGESYSSFKLWSTTSYFITPPSPIPHQSSLLPTYTKFVIERGEGIVMATVMGVQNTEVDE